MTEKGKIKICYNHQEYQVPLIWTFAFIGAEYWCPYCGYTAGMFGAGKDIASTPKLEERKKKYAKISKRYRHAQGLTYCSKTMYKGEYVKPQDLPQSIKDKLEKAIEEWAYKQRIN